MEFLVELILEIFGCGIESAMESPKTSLKTKIAILSVLCLTLVGAFVTLGILLYVNNKELLAFWVFLGLALVFVGLWIFGVIRLIKKNRR